MQGSKFLKVTGILMIIFGAIALVVSIIAVAGLGLVAALAESMGDISIGMLAAASVLALVGAVVELIAGIIGVKNWARPEKAGVCIAWGIIVLAISVISNTLTLVGYPESFSILSIVTGMAIPVLYLIGGLQNKKLRG